MSVAFEGKNSFFIGARAVILDPIVDRETASQWASKYVHPNPALKWVLGKYVEAEKANNNKQYWFFDDLKQAQPSIDYAPMNVNHDKKKMVGAFVANEMMFPQEEAAGADQNPFIEALGVLWSYYFPEESKVIEQAHYDGNLFYSMECVAKTVTCGGDLGCGEVYPYKGATHASYCNHINDHISWKVLNEPHFLAGALIVPPTRPGWSGAEIRELANTVEANAAEAEAIYESLKAEFPEQEAFQWEEKMLALMARAHMAKNL
jgi:hypothetical protein